MLKHSRLLFMDEATASVDSQTDGVIQKIIREDFADCTIISIAHRIPTVMDCDRVLVIDAGKLCERIRQTFAVDGKGFSVWGIGTRICEPVVGLVNNCSFDDEWKCSSLKKQSRMGRVRNKSGKLEIIVQKMETPQKPLMIVGLDDSDHSFYALQWTLDHFPNSPFKLLLLHSKPSPTSAIGFAGPGTINSTQLISLLLAHFISSFLTLFSGISSMNPGAADVFPFVDSDLKKIAARVVEKAKELCHSKSVDDVNVEVVEGDARNVLCEAVDRHHAAMLVGGFGKCKRLCHPSCPLHRDGSEEAKDQTLSQQKWPPAIAKLERFKAWLVKLKDYSYLCMCDHNTYSCFVALK
ncbi:hypothetical protein Ccrd_026769 [Cynara cardunculus var. scolymus]|uniref:Uncharacterized protein n=1 Tax=Cynara cardunculus var. scolymus TaxID=59895 RepID=A0A103JZY0_CYNCS|nr:hypothetical protein Ccrd_026769 [Cynara cardunculus var. scolymus]